MAKVVVGLKHSIPTRRVCDLSRYIIQQIMPADPDHYVIYRDPRNYAAVDRVAYIALVAEYEDDIIVGSKVIPIPQTEQYVNEDTYLRCEFDLFRAPSTIEAAEFGASQFDGAKCFACSAPYEKYESENRVTAGSWIASWDITHTSSCRYSRIVK